MAEKIVSDKNYVAGWLNTSLHDFLAILPRGTSTKYALSTCLDSNPNPAAIRATSPELARLPTDVQVIGKGLLIPTDVILDLESQQQIFFGFDEVWFFPTKSIEAKPRSISLVGPARVNRTRFRTLAKWMHDNSCSLALGGGEGLNFVVRAHGLVRPLLGFSLEQPDSSVAQGAALATR